MIKKLSLVLTTARVFAASLMAVFKWGCLLVAIIFLIKQAFSRRLETS